MKLKGSHLVAAAILAAIGGWMFTGDLIVGGQADPNAVTIAEREKQRSAEAFRVRVTEIEPSKRDSTLDIRGRTQARASVAVRAETGGTVERRVVSKGDSVAPGDLLCTLDKGVRDTTLRQAQVAFEQAQADYDATDDLLKRGFATRSRLRQLRTALDAAAATLAAAEQDLGRTEVRTTIAGQVTEPLAEAGDNLAPGGVCATIVQTDTMLFTGQVSEREIGNVAQGMKANVELVGGEAASGDVIYISPTSDERTRTFAVEVALPNADGRIREGVTASARIALEPTEAFRILPSWLVLADDGAVGVRIVADDETVAFKPVAILAQLADHMWVDGLEAGDRVITLGQDYVAEGETVTAVLADPAAEPEGESGPASKAPRVSDASS